ncbi:MAG: hypothetical protein R2856_10360 [Caldilineaceae bacterium]
MTDWPLLIVPTDAFTVTEQGIDCGDLHALPRSLRQRGRAGQPADSLPRTA